MVIFNNLCLKYVEVTFYQIARSLTIVFNILLTYFVLGQSTSKPAVICCLVIVLGYVLGTHGEPSFSLLGVIFGVLSRYSFDLWFTVQCKNTLLISRIDATQ